MVNKLIKTLEKEQKGRFVSFLKSKNKVKNTNNIQLFKAIEEGSGHDFKSKLSDSAYRGVKKRLKDNLLEFLSYEIIRNEITEELKIIKQLTVARKLMELSFEKEGFKILTRLEERAKSIDHYSLLHEIYHTLIQYSYHDLAHQQDVLFELLLANSKAQLNQEKLNMAFAYIKKQLPKVTDVKQLVEESYLKFEVDLNHGFNFKTLFQLCEVANKEGAYSNDYYSVNLFFEDKIGEIENSALDQPKYYTYKADLFLSMANIYLRKRDFKSCADYLGKAKEVLTQCSSEFYASRNIQLKTLNALCLNYSGKLDEGINELQDLPNQGLNVAHGNLALASLYFQNGQIKILKKILANYYRSDSYYEKNLGRDWVLNKIYIEVIIAIESGDIDFAEARMNSLIRRYGAFFKTQPQMHVLPFIKLVRYYCRYPEKVTTSEFEKRVNKTMNWKPADQEDLFLMTIYAWLKSKMQCKDLYEVVLELVNS